MARRHRACAQKRTAMDETPIDELRNEEARRQATQRLDKWLVCARLRKTRSLARALVAKGAVRIDGAKTRAPDAKLRIGTVLTLAPGTQILVLEVTGIAERRGPPSQARLLYRMISQARTEPGPAPPPPPAMRRWRHRAIRAARTQADGRR